MDLYSVVKKARFLACWYVALAMNSIFSLKLRRKEKIFSGHPTIKSLIGYSM